MADGSAWTPNRVADWLRGVLGVEVDLQPLTGGNSRLVAIAAERTSDTGGARWLVRTNLRHDPRAPFPIDHEAKIYTALSRTDVRAPVLRAVSDDGALLVTEVLEGDTDLHPLSSEGIRALTRDLISVLDELHKVRLDDLSVDGAVLGEPVPASMRAAVLTELQRWTASMRASTAAADPLIELGLRWLLDNVPDTPGAASLVHGDIGPDNFLYAGAEVTGLIDWEYAHLGDPWEDFGWLLMRTAIADLPDMAHEVMLHLRKIGALTRESARFDYQLVFVLWKVLVIRHLVTGNPGRNLGRDIFYRLLHRRMFVEALSRALGVPEPPFEAPAWYPTQRSWLFETAVQQLKVALPAIEDPADRVRLSGLVRTLRYLRLWDGVEERGFGGCKELADLTVEIRDGHVPVDEAFPRLASHVLAEYALCAELLGPKREVFLIPPGSESNT